MPAAPLSDLAARLDVPPDSLAFLSGFSATDLEVLGTAVAATLAADDEAVHEGLRNAVALIPRPLRGRAERLLTGGGDQ